jgi:hypothetical protein
MKTVVFTSTISPTLLAWVTAEAKRTKRTRRAVLESALVRYQREMIQAKMFADLSTEDKDEVREMAEWGMKEYAEDLAKYD